MDLIDIIRKERDELMKAIRAHRDQYGGGQVDNTADAKLYDALIWCEQDVDFYDSGGEA